MKRLKLLFYIICGITGILAAQPTNKSRLLGLYYAVETYPGWWHWTYHRPGIEYYCDESGFSYCTIYTFIEPPDNTNPPFPSSLDRAGVYRIF